MAGLLFHFDGVDGVGKSTQIGAFCQWLRDAGHEVVACRDPGSTALGERIRSLLLDKQDVSIHRRSEMLLYMAARAQMVEEVIRPALEAGRTVVADRFLLANVVYQGHAGGLDVETLWQVGAIATAGLQPTLTLLLDMDVDRALERLDRGHDRMESQGVDFLRRVRDGFLAEAARDPQRIAIINADQPVEQVRADIRHAANRVLEGAPT